MTPLTDDEIRREYRLRIPRQPDKGEALICHSCGRSSGLDDWVFLRDRLSGIGPPTFELCEPCDVRLTVATMPSA